MDSISTTKNISSNRNKLLNQPYAAIDLEFRGNKDKNRFIKNYDIYAIAIVDSLGNVKAKHESDFNGYPQPEKELIKWTMNEILQYKLTIGWYSKGVRIIKEDGAASGQDSDLKVLDGVCKFYNIPSIIAFDKRGVPYVRGYDYNLCKINPFYASKNKFDWYYHIDLYNIYKKHMIKYIYKNKYQNLKLDSVCKAILGEGKFEDMDGSQAHKATKEKQMKYVIQDASLVMKLSKHNNYEVFDLMNALSKITNVPFDKVCHNGISIWWDKIIRDKIRNIDCRLPTLNNGRELLKNEKIKEYKG